MDRAIETAATLPAPARRSLRSGSLASLLSTVAMAWGAWRQCGSAWVGLNAPSHWLWGDTALRARRRSLRYTAIGLAIHHLSSLFWACFFESAVRGRRPGFTAALAPAVGITTLAYVVDFKGVPHRLTPGFQHTMQQRHLYLVYTAFALGLALGARGRRH